jgi:hypothetical protein
VQLKGQEVAVIKPTFATFTRGGSANAVIRTCVVVVLATLSVACHDSGPTAPSASPPGPTWTITPTSVVMREGDTVVFRITSSGIPLNPPTCVLPLLGGLLLTQDLDVGAVGGTTSRTATPTKPANGQCTVTVTSLVSPGRVTLKVVEFVIGPPWSYVDVEATIDLVK